MLYLFKLFDIITLLKRNTLTKGNIMSNAQQTKKMALHLIEVAKKRGEKKIVIFNNPNISLPTLKKLAKDEGLKYSFASGRAYLDM